MLLRTAVEGKCCSKQACQLKPQVSPVAQFLIVNEFLDNLRVPAEEHGELALIDSLLHPIATLYD